MSAIMDQTACCHNVTTSETGLFLYISTYLCRASPWTAVPLGDLLLWFKQRRMRFKPIKRRPFVKRVAKNNSWNNGDRHKIHQIFPINCFVFVNSSLANSTQFGNDSNYSKFNGENIAAGCSRVAVLALDSLTRNTLATTLSWNFFYSDHQVPENKNHLQMRVTLDYYSFVYKVS